jgi:hypothetical protein
MAAYPINVSFRDLAVSLSARLNDFTPDGLSIGATDGAIEVYSGGRVIGGSPALEIIDENDDRSVPERIETAVQATLSGIQDVVIEDIHSPWPTKQNQGSSEIPQANCRVAAGELLVWFGDEEDPALALPPIRLR